MGLKDTWINQDNTMDADAKVVNDIANAVIEIEEKMEDSPSGDVVSPSVKVEETAEGATITITDKNGTTTATVKNGKDGSVLSAEQIADINDISNIRNTAMGADATASMAMSTAGTAFDLAEAAYASANQAMSSKQDRVFIETRSDMEEQFFDFSDMYNGELRLLDTPVIKITFSNDEYFSDYISGLSFDSGEKATSFVYPNSSIINWVGTDCSISEGLSVFAPAANTHYDVVFYYNGAQFIGLVNGFKPATSN